MANDFGLVARWKLAQQGSTDPKLSRTDVAVLMAILNCLDDSGVAWPGLKKIAADARADRSSAVRSVARLASSGYLVRESGSRTASNRYRMGDLGRCEVAPRCKAAPRRESAPGVGANSRLGVGANSHPDLAYMNLPIDLAQKIPRPVSRYPEFKAIYPRSEAMARAEKAWKSKKLDAIADEIIADVRARLDAPGMWRGKELKFIPHAASYLNAKRWTDDWQRSANVTTLLARDGRPQVEIDSSNEESILRMGGACG